MNIHHAPWSKRFQTMWFKGQYAYELQIGCLVIQWFYETSKYHPRFHVWRDHYTNSRSYLRYAPWGVSH